MNVFLSYLSIIMIKVHEACGVYGIYDFTHRSIYSQVYWGLVAQNHRGHQSHGLLTYQEGFHTHKALGIVPRINTESIQKQRFELPGHVGIGNVRYGTSGSLEESSLVKDIQPSLAEIRNTKVAISFNGNIVNISALRSEVSKSFSLNATSDAEILSKKLCLELETRNDLSEAVKQILIAVEGAYSVTGITGEGELFAFRDPLGIKPLCIGFSTNKEIIAISSESVGLDINSLNHFEETVKLGELLRITDEGIRREQLTQQKRRALCSFEFAYFSRPDSILNGSTKYVYEIRHKFGKNLGKQCVQKNAIRNIDVIIPIPETATDASYGFQEETKLKLDFALRKHRYVFDRAFISLPWERAKILEKKINVLGNSIYRKNIALLDDSIVRGDTTKSIIQRIRIAGAKKILLYVTFPKIVSPCFYGIDMATFSELIGVDKENEEIAEIIGADSVTYQTIDDFVSAIGLNKDKLCLACLTGAYPTPLAQKLADEKKASYQKGSDERKRIYE